MPALLHPQAPLIELYEQLLHMPRDAPVEIYRHDRTLYSDEAIAEILRRVTTLPGG